MFHSVGQENSSWSQSWLSVGGKQLDYFFRFLKKNGYKSVFAKDILTIADTPNKTVCLTFDDGYLDNYTILFPLLQRYNLRATIFVNSEFVDKGSNDLRPIKTYKEIINGETISLGFLNESEIKTLDSSKFVDVQSHTSTHDYMFKSNILVDVFNGQDKYHWLAWNIDKAIKPTWLRSANWKKIIPKGYPIFEYDRALAIRAYIPDERFIDSMINNKNKASTSELLNEFPGRFETDEEMILRYESDINLNSKYLENLLQKKITVLCWPGGGYNSKSLGLVKEAGISISTIGTKHNYENTYGSDHFRLRRFGLNSVQKFRSRYIHINFVRILTWRFRAKVKPGIFRYIFSLLDRITQHI